MFSRIFTIFVTLFLVLCLGYLSLVWRKYRNPCLVSFVPRVIIGNVYVVDRLGQNKVAVERKGCPYILQASHTPGDSLFLVAQVQTRVATGVTKSIFEFDYAQWLRMKGYVADLKEQKAIVLDHTKPSWFVRQRMNVQSFLVDVYGKNEKAGLLLGMMVGDTSLLPKERVTTLTSAGLVHILAVSGGNIALVVEIIGCILFWVPWRPRKILLLCVILIYGVICGLEGSVLRAVIMALLSLLGTLSGRNPLWRRMLAMTFVGMVFRNPFSLLRDIGFLLSFGAVIGIKMSQELPRRRFLGMIRASLGASFGVRPILLIWMGTVNMTGILVNILVVPVVSLLTIAGIVHGLIQKRWGRDGLYWIPDLLMRRIFWMGDLANQRNFSILVDALRLKRIFFIASIAMVIFWKKGHYLVGLIFPRASNFGKNQKKELDILVKSRQR